MTTAGSVGPSQAFRFTNSLRAPVGRKPRTPGVALACAVAQTRDPDPQLHPDEGRASTRNSSGCGQARRWPRSGAEHSEAPSSDGIPYLWRRKRAWQTYTQNGSSPGYVVPYRSAASSRASASVLSSTGWPRKRTSQARSATIPTASPSKSKARPTVSTPSSHACALKPRPSRASTRSAFAISVPQAKSAFASSPARSKVRLRPASPPMPRHALTAFVSFWIRGTAATAIPFSTAPTAARALPLPAASPTTGRRPRWRNSPCAPPVRLNMTTRSTAAFTPSRMPAGIVARASGSKLLLPKIRQTGTKCQGMTLVVPTESLKSRGL